MSVQHLLHQLDTIFQVLGIEDKLAAPISQVELQNLTQKFPFQIPAILETLYKWHNGINEFIPSYDFLSLSDAIEQYQGLIALEQEIQSGDLFNKAHFPILQFQDSWIFIDCSPNSPPVLYDFFLEDGQLEKKYENLEQMLQIVVDAYLSRAYSVADNLVSEDPVLLRKIEHKYFSEAQRDAREAQWNQLCLEVCELRSRELTQAQPDAEAAQLQELYAGLGLGAPSTLLKKSLIGRLSQTYDPRAVAYMIEFLGDSDPEIVAHAAFGLGTLKARERLPELLYLLHHSAEVVRNLAAHAIGVIISPDDQLVLQPLMNLLTDAAPSIRIAAIAALGQLRTAQAVLPLVHLLEDSNSNIRYHVIHALEKIGDIRALEPLQNRRSKALPDEVRLIDRAVQLIKTKNKPVSLSE